MDPYDDPCWDFIDYSLITDTSSTDLTWINDRAAAGPFISFHKGWWHHPPLWSRNQLLVASSWSLAGPFLQLHKTALCGFPQHDGHCNLPSVGREIGSSHADVVSQHGNDCPENDCTQKRKWSDSCSSVGAKASREKLRRQQLNGRFLDLGSILEHGRPVKTDKLVILNDAVKAIRKLRNEAQELELENEKLRDDIHNLKAEKKELHEESVKLKAEKERAEQQVKDMGTPSPSKIPVVPGYGLIPMWQYLPQSTVDTSRDHELRPPAA